MMTSRTMLGYQKAEPFRPFRIRMANRRTFDIRDAETIKVMKSSVLVFKSTRETPEIPDEWESVSLMLAESVSNLESPIRRSTND